MGALSVGGLQRLVVEWMNARGITFNRIVKCNSLSVLSALAMAGAFFDMDIEVFMVKVSYQQKPYRRNLMETYGATVHASPTNLTDAGRSILAKDPDSPGSLGIAISEAVEVAAKSGGTVKYSLGSVLNHVLMHQTIVGEEAMLQMEKAGDYPDVVIGCVGGGSNMAGLVFPFVGETLRKGLKRSHIGLTGWTLTRHVCS